MLTQRLPLAVGSRPEVLLHSLGLLYGKEQRQRLLFARTAHGSIQLSESCVSELSKAACNRLGWLIIQLSDDQLA